MKRTRLSVLVVACCLAIAGLLIPAGRALAVTGQVCSLTATDAPDPGDTITITATVGTPERIQNSNLYYEISIDGTVVATHQSDLPSTIDNVPCSPGTTDSWSLTNTGFPSSGTYTVTVYWRPGNCQSENCAYDVKSTTFVSAPTLGLWLSMAALAAIGYLLWRRRADFMPQGKLS